MDGITKALVRAKGVSPILMHNSRMANPLDEFAMKIKEITSKHHSKKTEADILKTIELEFNGALYFDDGGLGPYIPGVNIEGAIRDAARTSKQGKAVESGVVVDQDYVQLIYDGPGTRDGLFNDKRFVDTRAVKLQKSSTVMRTRPRFDKWELEFEVMAIDELVSISDVEKFIVMAGRIKGLCDYRPKFGRFIVEDFVVI